MHCKFVRPFGLLYFSSHAPIFALFLHLRYAREGGLGASAKDVGASIVRGIRGVFVDPLAGARRAGLLGFIKGVATGVAGLAARPIRYTLTHAWKL